MATKNKHKKLVWAVIAVILALPIFAGIVNITNSTKTNAISWICEQSEECKKAAAEEEAANQKNEESLNAANEYRVKVQELKNQISAQEAIISDTKNKIKDLKIEIKRTEVKLQEKREGLAEILVDMHYEEEAEPIKILAGSVSISDLAEKASRGEVAKQQISAATEAVRDAKESLEAQKTEVETLLEEQKVAQEELQNKRAEQQEFVTKYQNDADAYAEVAKAAREEQQKAIQAWQEAHPEYFQSTIDSPYAGAYNTYPWQAQCPWNQDGFIDANGYYGCECTSYAGWKIRETYGVVWYAWGNAADWYGTALAAGAHVSSGVPVAQSVGQVGGGMYGHVFWVESINEDGSINVTEYNNAYATQLYQGSFHYGDFGSRIISASEATQYNYLWP